MPNQPVGNMGPLALLTLLICALLSHPSLVPFSMAQPGELLPVEHQQQQTLSSSFRHTAATSSLSSKLSALSNLTTSAAAVAETGSSNSLLATTSTSGSRGGVVVDCAALPPALWCAKFVRSKCGTVDLCTRHDDTVRYRPLHITLLYESLCPFSQRFIKDTLFDVYTRFRSHIKLELVPYGNTKTNGTHFSCQHGVDECRINKFQSCAINYMPDAMPLVYCLETLLYEKVAFDEATKLCFNMVNPGSYVLDRIRQCFDGSEGDLLQGLAANRTGMAWPNKHRFVPWILVNNVSIESMQFLRYALPSLICESRADGEYVAECESW